jgi:hypothetical protein
MDDKVTKDSFKAYRDWQRYILRTKPKLTSGIRRATLIAWCLAMASHGANGQRCFASDVTLANEIGLNESKRVAPYRHEAIRLGWFAETGEHKGRVKVLSIATPDGDASVSVTAEHDTSTAPFYCPACQPYIAKVRDGEMTTDELHEVHRGY